MKKLLFFALMVSASSFAQYPTIATSSAPGLGVGAPTGANFGDAAIHVKAANNNMYGNGGGQQLFFGETSSTTAAGDYFRIMNASGTSALFSPMLSGFGNSHNVASLQLLALANSTRDNGVNPLMIFKAGLDYTPITSLETSNAGSSVVTRPLFQWSNWNTPKMTMLANGSLGLGTVTPVNAALHIVTGSNPGMLPPAVKLDRNDGTNQAGLLTIGISSNSFGTLLGGGSACFKLEDPYGNSANSDMGFSTNATAVQLVIKHNGYVGIGMANPTANFHSIGTARLESLPASTTNTDIITRDANGNLAARPASSLFGPSGWSLSGNAAAATDFLGTTNAQALNFQTNATQRMTIDGAGKLGLGTATPTGAAMHILVGSTPGMLPPVVKLDRNDATNQAGLLSIGISGNGFASGLLGGGSAYFKLEDPYGNSQNSDMGFSTNAAAAQMVIKHSGNVGIGTETPTTGLDVQNGAVRIGNVTTPTGYKLYVEQGILTEKVKVALKTSLAWADYVFANDYQLKSLSEVETFINEHKHLPNVPSADELVNDGLDLGKMQAIQMEKIEELTLYLIEMKKEIDTLKKENELLNSKK